MFPMIPRIDPEIARLAPGFCALSIVVEAAPVIDTLVGERALARACAALGTDEAPWALEHLAAWDQVFKGFGAKPARTPCSAQALRKRVLRDGVLPAIDPVVDLYNAISIEYAIPVGGEDLAAYVGTPRLVIADGSECFDTLKEGLPIQEAPAPGEVVWRDDLGVTCRRWNWRQGIRTRLSLSSPRMWFIL
ncbi:B3/4 domain-containing protein [Aeromonas sp. R10-1]